MKLKYKASVYTSDGNEAGSLHRVVIDPGTEEVTHIVIQKGLLITENKVIAVAQVASASEDKVTLNCTADEVKEMSPLEIEQYAPLSDTLGQGQKYDPMTGGVYTNPTLERSIITEVKRTIPDELVALKEGAQVLSEDDEQVGNVDCLFTEPGTGKVISLAVSQGLLFKTRKFIPIQWVRMLGDDHVRLTVGAQQLEDLPADEG
jgi:uncharacterized protein YrrD